MTGADALTSRTGCPVFTDPVLRDGTDLTSPSLLQAGIPHATFAELRQTAPCTGSINPPAGAAGSATAGTGR